MRVILLEEIPGLGELGAVVRVKDGFARNFLLPRRKADRATQAAVAEFERRRAELEERQRNQLAALENARAALDGQKIPVVAKAGPDGGLYGSVTPAMVAAAVNRVRPEGIAEIAKGQVHMPTGHLKQTGEAEVEVALRPGLRARVIVVVTPEGAEVPAPADATGATGATTGTTGTPGNTGTDGVGAGGVGGTVDSSGGDHLQQHQEQE